MDHNKILRMMKARGINNKELSELSGVPLGTLNKILYGTTKEPSVNAMRDIAHALGCTLDELIDDGSSKAQPDDLTEYLDELRYRPEMRMLFSVSKKASKEDVEKAVKIIEMLKGDRNDD